MRWSSSIETLLPALLVVVALAGCPKEPGALPGGSLHDVGVEDTGPPPRPLVELPEGARALTDEELSAHVQRVADASCAGRGFVAQLDGGSPKVGEVGNAGLLYTTPEVIERLGAWLDERRIDPAVLDAVARAYADDVELGRRIQSALERCLSPGALRVDAPAVLHALRVRREGLEGLASVEGERRRYIDASSSIACAALDPALDEAGRREVRRAALERLGYTEESFVADAERLRGDADVAGHIAAATRRCGEGSSTP